MTVPSVTLQQLDNQIGIVDDGGERLAIIACATSGDLNTPKLFAQKSDVVAEFTSGRLVEAAAWALEFLGREVLLVRADETTAGAFVGLDATGVEGTSVVTADAVEPIDDFEVVVTMVNGCTVGVTGGTYTYSLDGGRTTSAVQSLGTANTLTLPGNVGVAFDLAAGTLLAGDTWTCRTTGPKPSSAQYATALDALKVTDNAWALCLVEGPLVAADFTAIASAGTAMETLGDERFFIGSFRVPTDGESEATYLAAFTSAFGSSVSDRIVMCYGAAEMQSPVSQNQYLSRPGMDVAIAILAQGRGKDPAHVRLGPRPSAVRIKDANNNPKHHDELLNPGADDQRATAYRSFRRRKGVFINNVRLMSATGSDFRYVQHRRVMNHAREIVRRALELYLSEDLVCDPNTGRVLESEAKGIDETINHQLEEDMTNQRECTAAVFQLNRTDDVLRTFTLRGSLKVTPLAYPKGFVVTVAFYNPALRVVTPEED